ncbi:hypothetical protein [Streptomyces sp. NPDC002788]
MGSEEHVCPTCGQPVETVVRRHKTLGAWVPRWSAGPCRNPECRSNDAQSVETGRTGEAFRRSGAPRKAEGTGPAEVARLVEGTAPPATTPPEAAPGGTVAENP